MGFFTNFARCPFTFAIWVIRESYTGLNLLNMLEDQWFLLRFLFSIRTKRKYSPEISRTTIKCLMLPSAEKVEGRLERSLYPAISRWSLRLFTTSKLVFLIKASYRKRFLNYLAREISFEIQEL